MGASLTRFAGWAALSCVLFCAACSRGRERSTASSEPVGAAQSVAQPALAPAAPAPASPAHSLAREDLLRAQGWLSERLRGPATDPESPWILAHGLLAFGPELRARDGRLALDVVAGFATPRDVGGARRYGFPAALGERPIEPHPHLYVKRLLQLDVDPDRALRAADGSGITPARLVDDMRAVVREPATDTEWLEAAWWIEAVELAKIRDGKAPPGLDLERLRNAALVRLEADDAVIALDPGPAPFAPDAPMGAAKRAKSHVYAHACGGLHFLQAVMRGVAASGSPELGARLGKQMRLLFVRARAERTLYRETLATHPTAALVLRAQQLKFFGHLLEALALAESLGLARDPSLAAEVADARRDAAAELVAAVDGLAALDTYGRLDAIAREHPQLHLDLVGDGCHALRALELTASRLPSR